MLLFHKCSIAKSKRMSTFSNKVIQGHAFLSLVKIKHLLWLEKGECEVRIDDH
jgi:hypothetical protein